MSPEKNQAHRESEARYRFLFEFSPAAVYSIMRQA